MTEAHSEVNWSHFADLDSGNADRYRASRLKGWNQSRCPPDPSHRHCCADSPELTNRDHLAPKSTSAARRPVPLGHHIHSRGASFPWPSTFYPPATPDVPRL